MNANIGSIIDKANYCLFPGKGLMSGMENLSYRTQNLNILDYMEQATRADSLADIYNLCDLLRQHYDLSFFGAGLMAPAAEGKPTFNHIYSDCDWINHYLENNFLRIDPFVRHCVEQINPLIWKWNNNKIKFSTEENRVMQDAQDFGVSQVITIPWHGPNGEMGGMKITNANRHDLTDYDLENILPSIITASHSIHEALYRVTTKLENQKVINLSPREREILSWSALGKDSWGIAQILNISENTVNTHLKNAYKKLNVRSRQHAVAKAVCLKLIYI